MKDPKELIQIAAKSDITVLIQGESGTGKEVAARYLHEAGPRRNGPFVALNCGAITRNLIESILEGAKKGAYTGAIADQPGVVRAANGGTLFLDEIGELPLDCQCRLLRILQERAVMPVGSTQSIPVDFRLVCATNRNLRHEVAAERFREDLFYRISTFPITLAPLRERTDFDSLVLEIWSGFPGTEMYKPAATHLPTANNLSAAENLSAVESLSASSSLSAADIAQLHLFNWPGNIRQLKNVLERYALMRHHGVTLEEILCEEYADISAYAGNSARYAASAVAESRPDWDTIQNMIERCGGNKAMASRRLGISRSNLYEQIKKANLKRVAI